VFERGAWLQGEARTVKGFMAVPIDRCNVGVRVVLGVPVVSARRQTTRPEIVSLRPRGRTRK
jgi:hypothetical protein